VEASADQDLDR